MAQEPQRNFWSIDVNDIRRMLRKHEEVDFNYEPMNFYFIEQPRKEPRPDECIITEIDTSKLGQTVNPRRKRKPSEPRQMAEEKTIQEKLQNAKYRITRLEKAVDFLANKVVSAERNAVLRQLRLEFVFDEEAEQKLCHFSKMTDAQFKKHCMELRASCAHEQTQRTLWPEADITQSFPFMTPTSRGMDEQKLVEDFRRIPPNLQLYALELINTMANAAKLNRSDENDENER
ncbi:MAG: hypothetical protein Q4G03_09470 [Planctomycetia bacterium]|nr:hypothetical protein [Planctomycetia bacterium]